MKKSNLFLVLMMALVVMSCSNDETTMSIPQKSNAIEFGTYMGRDAQTRATMINDAAALQGTGFGVFAYYTDNTDYVAVTSKPNFMYNQGLVWNTSLPGKWEYSPVKYWPNEDANDKLSFFAYAPYSATDTDDNFAFAPVKDASGDPTINYVVNEAAKLQEDLLWGVNESGLPFKNQQKQTTTGNIKFQFKHALARIGFNVEAMIDSVNGDIADSTDIVVTKVELIGNFYGSGALNLNNAKVNVPLWTGVPATPTAGRTFVLNAATDATNNFVKPLLYGKEVQTLGQLVASNTVKQKLNNDASYLMVIPQEFNAEGGQIKIRVTYDVITADNKLETEQSKVTNVITSTPFDFSFVGGNAYTFNLHLGMTSVKFDAEVSAWTEGGTETVVNALINTKP